MNLTTPSLLRRLAFCSLLFACLCSTGCNVGGALAYKFFGPTRDPAEYTPPKDQPLVVIVENFRNPADLQQPADELAMMISGKLAGAKVAPIIPTDRLVALRTEQGAAFEKLKIPEIGRALGAKQIVYVNLRQCTFQGVIGADDVKCNVEAVVKVVDVETGVTKYPDAGDGKVFKNNTDFNRSEGRKTEESIRMAVLDDLSDGITQLFYAHQPESELPKD